MMNSEWRPHTGPDNRIDNDTHTMRQAISVLLSDHENNILNIASGYFRLSALSLLEPQIKAFMKRSTAKPKMRWLLSNRLSSNTANLFNEFPVNNEAEKYSMDNDFYEQIQEWINNGDIEIRVFVGEDYIEKEKKNSIRFLHGKVYLFSNNQSSNKGDVLIGSSNFTRGGLLDNRELNIFSNDSWPALDSWFKQLWSSYSKEYSSQLLDDFSNQKQYALLPKNHIPVNYIYWLLGKYFGRKKDKTISQRILDIERALPYSADISGNKYFIHQRVGIQSVYEKLKRFDTQILADGVGLGKTLEAASIVKLYLQDLNISEDKRKVLVFVNSRLQEQWKSELKNVGQNLAHVDFITRQKFANATADDIEKMSQEYALIIIDEAHEGFLKSNNRSYKNVKSMISYARDKNALTIRGLLLTATPWNNSREDVIRLGLLFLNLEVVPWDRKYKQYLVSNREKILFDNSNGNFNKEAYIQFWQDLYVQRTRVSLSREKFLSEQYPTRVFPLEKESDPYKIEYSMKVSKALQNALKMLINLHLPYQDTVIQYFNSDYKSSLVLRQRQQLLRRADSSNAAFSQSMRNIRIRLLKFEQDLKKLKYDSLKNIQKYFITQIDKEYAERMGDEIEELFDFDTNNESQGMSPNNVRLSRINLINNSLTEQTVDRILTQMLNDTHEDLDNLAIIMDQWDLVAKSDIKQKVIIEQVKNIVKKGRKVLLFSEYKDTVKDYYHVLLNDADLLGAGVGMVAGGIAEMNYNSSTKEDVLGCFSPESKQYKLIDDNEISILIGTDAISTGQNLQDASDIMTIELPYNPMRLEQRIGRIDRPKRNGDNSIYIYAFPSDEIINAEIELTNRYEKKAEGAASDTQGDINLPFINKLKRSGLKLALQNNETASESKDMFSKPEMVSDIEARNRVAEYYDEIGNKFILPSNIVSEPYSFSNDTQCSVLLSQIELHDINDKVIVKQEVPTLYTIDANKLSFVDAESRIAKSMINEDVVEESTVVRLVVKANIASESILNTEVSAYNNKLRVVEQLEIQPQYVNELRNNLIGHMKEYRELFKSQKLDGIEFRNIVLSLSKRGFNKQQKQFLRGLQNSQGVLDSAKVASNIWKNLPLFMETFNNSSIINTKQDFRVRVADVKKSKIANIAGLL